MGLCADGQAVQGYMYLHGLFVRPADALGVGMDPPPGPLCRVIIRIDTHYFMI